MMDHETSRHGGEPGALGEVVLNPDGNGERFGSKEIRVLKRGDVVSFRTSGAGGMGEKNYLVMGSERGGHSAANAYTLIETAKLNAVDPQA